MKNKTQFFTTLVLLNTCLVGLISGSVVNAAESATKALNDSQPDYTRKGADTCLKCHDEDSKFPVLSIFKTRHAQKNDARTPFATLQCETCHGPGSEHAKDVPEGQKQAPINNFGNKSRLTTREQNQVCLNCHSGNNRVDWHAGAHESGDVVCASCHKVHATHDAVLETRSQPEVCYQCHQKQRADFLKPSKHPVRFGHMSCSDCHSPHGSTTPAMLNQPTVNQACFVCHADKRGPLLWEHAPVTEDCRNCHTPHGSVNPSLLVKRPPLLCQQCHSQFGHPSVARDSTDLPGANPSAFLLSGSCINCHSQIHGSNHPSGVKLMR